MRRLPLYLVVISCCVSMALLSANQPEELPSPTPEVMPTGNFLYAWNTVAIRNIVVKDGDSFFCDFAFTGTLVDKNVDCRMLGYDAWEASYARQQAKDIDITPEEIILGKKAKAYLSNLLLTAENNGKPIHAVYYVGSNPGILRATPPADNYGRKLIFVYIDGQPLSRIMTEQGHAPRRNLPKVGTKPEAKK